ncbi:LAFA_0E13740g1_1 [Lachancea sp. 'fantastica']|nr:LAFA_0E13740g1_1 [Lachancea sp. 'fantastica']
MSGKRTPEDYVFLETLGQGSYSTVFRALERNNSTKNYAVKVCSKRHIIQEKKVKYVTIEKDLLNKLGSGGHPGIVRLFCTFHDAENLYFVLEYVSGGELLGLVRKHGPLPEIWYKHLFAQLVDTVDYMHSHGVIHRDLKPENVLLSHEGRVVITDFGAACSITTAGRDRSASFVGTAEYVAPELLLYSQCGLSSDIWALGCILYQLTQGVPPFRGENELQTFEQIVHLDYKWRVPTIQQVITLVRNILVLDPLLRPTTKQLKQDPWLSTVNWGNKSTLWKGIWELSDKSKNGHTNIQERPVTTVSAIRPVKKKPAQTRSTGAIVEWRQKLGLNSVPSPPSSTGNASFSSNVQPMQPEIVRQKPQQGRPQGPSPTPPSSTTTRSNSNPRILKRDLIRALEIPYNSSQGTLSFDSYSTVDDSAITDFATQSKSDILERSSICFMTLDAKGNLSCQDQHRKVKHMISISDPALSMYDFEFDEDTRTGFLILEKYKTKLWFLSAAPPNSSWHNDVRALNSHKSWVDSFFMARNLASTTENRRPKSAPSASSQSIPRNTPQVAAPKVKPRPKTNANSMSNMMVSSSRYEVLHALSSSGRKGTDASSGASAAFRSLKKK